MACALAMIPKSPSSCFTKSPSFGGINLNFAGGGWALAPACLSPRLSDRRGFWLPELTIKASAATMAPVGGGVDYEELANEDILLFSSGAANLGTFYDVLGIASNADAQTVRSAYRKLALRYHPDTVASPRLKERYTAAFLKINDAYSTLCDTNMRAKYDLQLSLQSPVQSTSHQRYAYTNTNTRRSPRAAATAYTPKSPSKGYCSPSTFTPRGRSWESDQCW